MPTPPWCCTASCPGRRRRGAGPCGVRKGDVERRLARLERLVAAGAEALPPLHRSRGRRNAADKAMSIIRKLFVANRAEIALRIVRTARRLGIQTVALARIGSSWPGAGRGR